MEAKSSRHVRHGPVRAVRTKIAQPAAARVNMEPSLVARADLHKTYDLKTIWRKSIGAGVASMAAGETHAYAVLDDKETVAALSRGGEVTARFTVPEAAGVGE